MKKTIESQNTNMIPDQLDGFARIAAADAMASSLAYSLERKFLNENIADDERLCVLGIGEDSKPRHSKDGYNWIKITHVGELSANSKENCFEAMQSILHSCHMPNVGLAFLLIGEEGVFHMYMGVNGRDNREALQNFTSSNWKGVVSSNAEEDVVLNEFFEKDKYENCHALTGIPSRTAKDKYARSIEQVVGGSIHHRHIAYLVTADPVMEEDVDDVLGDCRDVQGEIDSFKGFSVSESLQKSASESLAKSISNTVTESEEKDAANGETDWKKVAVVVGVGLATLAAIHYLPALAVLPKAASGAVAFSKAANSKKTFDLINKVSNYKKIASTLGFSKKSKPVKKTRTVATATSESSSETLSASYSQTVTQTISNSNVDAAAELAKRHAERFQAGKAIGMWTVGCYVFCDMDRKGLAASQVKAVVSGDDSIYEPVRVHDLSLLLANDNGYVNGFKESVLAVSEYVADPKKDGVPADEGFEKEPFRHPFGSEFSMLTTMLTTRELTCLINFPLSSVPGISVEEVRPEFSQSPQRKHSSGDDVLDLGRLIYRNHVSSIPVSVNMNAFSRHSLVAGVNGSGKTNTVLGIMEGFLKKGKNVLVFEPAKTEYVDWALKYNREVRKHNENLPEDAQRLKEIKIFIPGCNYYAKGNEVMTDVLRLNPFEVIPSKNRLNGYRVVSHLDRLKSVLAGAFPMQEILPTVIERMLYLLYDNAGWLEKDDADSNKQFPTLTDINLLFIRKLMDKLGYAEENTLNISAALRTRFNSMKQGWKNDLLNNERLQGMSWEDLFESPCIINLSYVGDDSDKAFIMSLIMQFLYEYRVAESEKDGYTFNDNECRHLAVIEEAHRVMTDCPSPELPQYRSNQMFASILSEVRAYGQGIMVVDQVPSRLIEDAVKNTNIKIIHKIVAADDARILAESVGLTQDQQRVIPKLSIGEGILVGLNCMDVGSGNSGDIYLAKINKMK